MKNKARILALLFPLIFIMTIGLILFMACTLDTPISGADRVSYPDKALDLVDITDAVSYSPRSMHGEAKTAIPRAPATPGGALITLVAEVAPPSDAQGRKLQASHVELTANGKYAIVSYMLRENAVSGAIDIFDVSNPARPTLLRNILFPNFDIAAVIEEPGTLFLAGQTLDDTGAGKSARVTSLSFSDRGVVDLASEKTVQLPGYFATDLVRQNGLLFVTTGTYSVTQPAVGLYALEPTTLATSASLTNAYPDARSVVVDGSDVAVFEAQYTSPLVTCHLDIYRNGVLGSTPSSIALTSYPATAEAKAKMAYYQDGELFLVATNRSGVAIIDAQTKSFKTSIPAPSLPANIVPLENQSSNAVAIGNSGSKDIVFIANGEAGLWVGDGDLIKHQPSTSTTASISGSIRFGAGESVNFVASKNTLAVAAVGTGGLKMLTIKNQ